MNTLCSVWRLLESEYTRLPGFKREISFWINQYNISNTIDIEEKNPDNLNYYIENKSDYFVKLTEDIIQSNVHINERITTLESLRYFTKKVDSKYLPIVATIGRYFESTFFVKYRNDSKVVILSLI